VRKYYKNREYSGTKVNILCFFANYLADEYERAGMPGESFRAFMDQKFHEEFKQCSYRETKKTYGCHYITNAEARVMVSFACGHRWACGALDIDCDESASNRGLLNSFINVMEGVFWRKKNENLH